MEIKFTSANKTATSKNTRLTDEKLDWNRDWNLPDTSRLPCNKTDDFWTVSRKTGAISSDKDWENLSDGSKIENKFVNTGKLNYVEI